MPPGSIVGTSRKPALFRSSLLALVLATVLEAKAAGLGKLSVYSGIGQPLNAEIALTATTAELASMTVKLASHEAFREAGIEFMPQLTDLRLTLDKNAAGQPIIRLSSVRPINEPFLHFLLELNWSAGRVVREYTFLLDPPESLQAARPASVVAPVTPSTRALPAEVVTAAKPARERPTPAMPAARREADAGEYRVMPGDTLAKVARATKPAGITLEQMLAALYEQNPEAFVGNNMNRLRAGKILRVPSAEEAQRHDPARAHEIVVRHQEEFNRFRSQLAAAAPPRVETSAPSQESVGLIQPRVAEKAPAPAPKDKLEVSRSEPAKSAPSSSLEEDLIARDKALREAAERIAQLEKNIENLKRLVEVKSQAGAQLQPEPPPVASPPAEKSADAQKAEPAAAATPAPASQTTSAPAPASQETAASKPPASDEPAKPSPPPASAPSKPQVAPAPVVAEPSFIEENPQLVYGGGGIVALLLAYLGYSNWRRRKAQAAQPSSTAEASAPAVVASTAPAGTPPVAFDAGELSIQGDYSEGGLLAGNEIVDPVAEAEVLMAYGRDRQAEEVLLDGLSKDPTRTAIHLKLLELYAKQENPAQFEAIATKLHSQCQGQGSEWEKALALARTLGLSGGIFALAAPIAETFAAPATPVAEAASATAVSETAPVEPLVISQPEIAPSVSASLAEAAPDREKPVDLNFDFDIGEPAVAESVAEPATTAAAPTPPASEDISLDFDFDLGSDEARAAVEAAVEHSVMAAEAPAAATPPAAETPVLDLDFDLDLDLPQTQAAEEAAAAAMASTTSGPEAAPPLDLEALDFDLDLGTAGEVAHEDLQQIERAEAALAEAAALEAGTRASEPVATPGLAKLDLDFDLELEVPEEEKSLAAPAVPNADRLDEPQPGEGAAAPAPVAASPVDAVATSPDNPEVATKLELAQAYEEMGDLEGARELLNEVLNEGSEAQQREARIMLERISA